jgi:multidrug efflux pump subunit AcrA (membrane-fusion protein)
MKPFFAAIVATGLALTGCRDKDSDNRAHEPAETETGVTFNEKNGLLVPPETAKFIGLQVTDVEEQKIAATFQFSAQVYRAASETQFASLPPGGVPVALASGSVTPANAARLSEGQKVSVRSADSEVSLPGHIVTLKRDLEKASGQVEVLLAVSDGQQSLAPGAFVSVTVPFDGKKKAVSVPRSALLRTIEGDFVYTMSGEHFVRTPVQPGLVDQEFVEITDGLYAGDQVVVQPVMTLWMAELQTLRGGKGCTDIH